ncbi:acyltransferase family protein [Aliagarivorans marinus]|uniref:acyltransferase family protein n=1 Tax=Aliagarivorans marinus TaxID=561965 RepID=UPI0004096DEB|nr:acyltransferase [Aliagarivorans marinus]
MDNALSKQQSLFIDYAKGLGILLVVIGHYNWQADAVYTPYLFHMPLFFILGGLVLRPYADERRWARKWLRSYPLYYVVWYTVIGLITLALTSLFDTRIVLYLGQGWDIFAMPLRGNSHANSLFMIGWFLVSYALVSGAFRIVVSRSRGRINRYYLLLATVVLAYLATEYLAPAFHAERLWYRNVLVQLAVGSMYMAFGYALRPWLDKLASFNLMASCWIVLATIVALGWVTPLGMSWSEYPDGFVLHTLSAVLGSVGLLSLCYLLSQAKPQTSLQLLGRYSKDIMTLHLLMFVLLDILFASMGLLQMSYISALHHWVSPKVCWLYMLVGCVAPIALRMAIDSTKRAIKQRTQQSAECALSSA